MHSYVFRTKNHCLHLCGEPGFPNNQKVVLFSLHLGRWEQKPFFFLVSDWKSFLQSILIVFSLIWKMPSLTDSGLPLPKYGAMWKVPNLFFLTDTDAISWFISLFLSISNCMICVHFLTRIKLQFNYLSILFLMSIYSFFQTGQQDCFFALNNFHSFCFCYFSVAACSSLTPFWFPPSIWLFVVFLFL